MTSRDSPLSACAMPANTSAALLQQSVFDIDRKPVRDLAPEEEALAIIRVWYNPPRVEGMVCGDDMYGPIKMIARGDDFQPRIKLFHFNPEKTPMIWEFSPLEEQITESGE